MSENTEAKQLGTATQDVLRFAQVVTWLDEARWIRAEDPIENPLYARLEPPQKILVHWLCYITNRQRPARDVWQDGGFVFSSIVGDYSAGLVGPGDARRFLSRHQVEGWGKLWAYCATHEGTQVTYTPRFGDDQKSVERTLTILADYDRSLVQFISHFVSRLRGQDQALKRVAHALDILSYRLELSIERARWLLDSKDRLSAHFQTWRRSSTRRHKRLWAALRDYRKPGSPLRTYLETELTWPELGFELDQLELPGDVWNERFSDRLVSRIASSVRLRMSRTSSSQAARQLYECILEVDPATDFYPERLDFSFDFAPRMCDLGRCHVCLFGAPTEIPCLAQMAHQQGQLCPVLSLSCGYRYPCRVGDCPVADETSYGLCEGESNDSSSA